MNDHYTYFLILAASITGPLLLSFDKKVAFYKKWKYLFPAMTIPAVLYIIWDIYFTSQQVWSFHENYIVGIKLINLPIEEVLFFFVVPYCCVFIYECIRCYFPRIENQCLADVILKAIGIVLAIVGLIFYKNDYTSWTFILCAAYIAFLYVLKQFFKSFQAHYFLIAYAVILIPFLVVNGFLTAIPVVLYNNDENLRIRIFTIPFEDIFYGMLLTLMNISIYEKLRQRAIR